MKRKGNPRKEVVTLQHRTATGTTSREKITPTRLPPPPPSNTKLALPILVGRLYLNKISGMKHDPRNKPIRIPEASTGGEGAHGTPPVSLGIDLGERSTEEPEGSPAPPTAPRS